MSTIKKVHRRKPTAIAGKTLKPIEQSLAELKAETAREKEKRVDRNAIPKQTKKANRQKRRSKPSASKQSVSELLQQVVQRTNASSTSSVSNGEDCSSTIGVPEGRLQHSIAERRDSWDSQDASSTCYSGTNSEDDEDSLGDSTFPGLHHHNHHHHHHNHHGRDPPTNRSMDSNSSTISSYRTLGAHGGKAYLGSTSLDGSSESSSVYTARTMMTNRELLSQIALRAERRQAPPAYVPRMDELLAAQISWDKKPLPPGVDRSKPPINIIPCMHPIELILAKADLRTRKRHRTLRLRAQKEEEKVRAIDASIQHKFGRAERYAAIAARINRQRRFMVILVLTQFMRHLRPRFTEKLSLQRRFQNVVESGVRIQRFCKQWYRRYVFVHYQLGFLRTLKQSELLFRLSMRIFRKRRATLKVRTFLQEYKGHHKMNVVVHKYLTSVRKIQRLMRDFLACQHGKVASLAKIWDRLEKVLITKVLERRRSQKRAPSSVKGLDQQLMALAGKDMIELKNQALAWQKIDAVMEQRLQQLKQQGVIRQATPEEEIEKYVMDPAVRDQTLSQLLRELRKEFYTAERAVVRRQMEASSSAFNDFHAAEMLRGESKDVSRIFREKFDKHFVRLNYKPFMLFRAINNKLLYERIRATHKRLRTFEINIDR